MNKTLFDKIWKTLGVCLVIYGLIAGIKIPLKPGIYEFSPREISTGINSEVEITTYNTHFIQSDNNNVWLAFPNDSLIKAQSIEVINENHIKARINVPHSAIPEDAKSVRATLVVDNEIDGYAIYPEGLGVRNSGVDDSLTLNWHPYESIQAVDSFAFPFRNILYETIRNTFYHVAIWFAMFLLLIKSCYHSIRYLINKDQIHDLQSAALTTVALWFGIAGILTGSMWAKFTWGTFWTSDIKLNMSAIAMLVYFAYWLLRKSINDIDARARLAAVYNLFAFVCLMVLVMVIPRLTDSLHPGNGGNPALGGEDLDNTLRAVFYPVIIGYTLIGLWMSQLYFRFFKLKDKYMEA